MKRIFKLVLSAVLCVSLMLTVSAPALGVGVRSFDRESYVVQNSEKSEYIEFFNTTVNTLKTELPYAVTEYSAGVPEDGMTKVSDGGETPMNATAQKFIDTLFDGMFNRNSSVFRSLIQIVLGAEAVNQESIVLHRGAKRDSIIPVYGEEYVSALTYADDYDLLISQKSGEEYPSEVAVSFQDVALADAEKSSLPRVFTLPTGSVDARLINGTDKETASFLESVKLEDLVFTGAKINAKYSPEGVLTYYGSVISYDFSFSYFEALKLVDAVLGIDIYKTTVETMNTVVLNLERDDLTAEKILEARRMHVIYTVKTEVRDIDYSPRYFGDVDDNGEITSADARTALRHSVGIADIIATEDLMYTDMDFDGAITAADARLILRTAVGLDLRFQDVPEGCTVKIIVVEQDRTETDTDEEDTGDKTDDFGGLIDIETDVSAADIVQSVFDTINKFREAEGAAESGITSFIEIIKGLAGA